MTKEWKPIGPDIPLDGTPFEVLTTHTFRFAPYKQLTVGAKNANSQMVKGVLGRWQMLDEQDHWVNCEPPLGLWKPHT